MRGGSAMEVEVRADLPRSFVIPAQAGIQKRYASDPAATSSCLNSRLLGDDGGGRGSVDVLLMGGGRRKVSKFTQVAPIASPVAWLRADGL